MTEDEDEGETDPARNAEEHPVETVTQLHTQRVENTSQHTASQAKRIETEVGKQVSHQASRHIIGSPKSGTHVDEDIPFQIVE